MANLFTAETVMSASRRSFLKAGVSLPLGLGLCLESGELWAQDNNAVDQNTLDFWVNQVRKPNQDLAQGITGKGPVAEVPAFVFFDVNAKAFHVADSLADSGLAQKGDATVSLRVERFRPSTADAASFQNSQTGSLRIDLGQTTPLPGLVDALAWTSVAAILPAAGGKLPNLDKLSFDPGTSWGQSASIPIPSGLGFWSWNVFLKKPESWWGKMIQLFSTAGKVVFPLLGMPAIALTALQAVDKMIGYAQAADGSSWLMKCRSIPVYATKEAKAKANGSDAIQIQSGTYLIMPQSQLSKFGQQQANLEVANGGYLVPKNTTEFDRITAAEQTLPDVTYLAVDVQTTVKTS